ncbi:MAG: CBS domain-containing protein [Deltaproteobacteria bacterium]|nr:CBS domain-containing protein [Deltaproteobacteria bacterium]
MGKDTLTELKVRHAMRKQLIVLGPDDTIDCCIQYLIKYKVNAILAGRYGEKPLGVVSKTDIMGAWYSELPLSTPVEMIMNSPPLFCRPDDTLDSALNTMKSNKIYRLYALEEGSNAVIGAIAYPDIVGLLYHYCSHCDQGLFNKRKEMEQDRVKRYKVHEIMTKKVESCQEDIALESVVEILSASRFGAILIVDNDNYPRGVISKTDITLCYRHGQDLSVPAKTIMSSPVALCYEQNPVESAIKSMIIEDLHRLFVIPENRQAVSGVISLTDAARLRSGSCHACISSRIRVDKN